MRICCWCGMFRSWIQKSVLATARCIRARRVITYEAESVLPSFSSADGLELYQRLNLHLHHRHHYQSVMCKSEVSSSRGICCIIQFYAAELDGPVQQLVVIGEDSIRKHTLLRRPYSSGLALICSSSSTPSLRFCGRRESCEDDRSL